MALYFKPLFSWKEPRAYRDLRKKLRGPQAKWFKPLYALLVFALLLTLCYSNQIMHPTLGSAELIGMLSIIVSFSFGYVYLAVPLMETSAETIEIFPDAIRSKRLLRFKNVTSYGWLPVHDFFLLVLYSKQHRPLISAVPGDLHHRIEALLGEHQVPRHATPIVMEQLFQPKKPVYALVISCLSAFLVFGVVLAVGIHILKGQVDLLQDYYKASTQQMLAIKQELKAAHLPPKRIKELMQAPEPPFVQMVQTFATTYIGLAFLLLCSLLFAAAKIAGSSARLKPPSEKDPVYETK